MEVIPALFSTFRRAQKEKTNTRHIYRQPYKPLSNLISCPGTTSAVEQYNYKSVNVIKSHYRSKSRQTHAARQIIGSQYLFWYNKSMRNGVINKKMAHAE